MSVQSQPAFSNSDVPDIGALAQDLQRQKLSLPQVGGHARRFAP